MTTSYVYGIIQHISTLISAIIIAFVYDWRTAFVSVGLLPFLIGAGVIRMSFRSGSAIKTEGIYK